MSSKTKLFIMRTSEKSKCKTLEELSEKTGIGIEALFRYERGTKKANKGILKQIAAAIGCKLEDIQE